MREHKRTLIIKLDDNGWVGVTLGLVLSKYVT
jgi:hypothetical protein